MLATLIIIGLVLLLGLQWVIVNYNRMARLRQHIRESWSDIDVATPEVIVTRARAGYLIARPE